MVDMNVMKAEIKDQLLKELSHEAIKADLLKELREELKLDSVPPLQKSDNFFNKNPLITFAISSVFVIIVFKFFTK